MFAVASGVRDLVQSIRRGDVQQLRGIFTRNRDVVDAQDPEGKVWYYRSSAIHLLLDTTAVTQFSLIQYTWGKSC